MKPLLERVAEAFDRLGLSEEIVLLAISGGPDSLALLDLAAKIGPARRLTLVAAHFDHGIHPDSATVAARCENVARRYRLPFLLGHGELGPDASETRARLARLEWLEATRAQQGARLILTAHHRDDQVETVLMRFLRGSGPAGLAGIAERRGAFGRPLLQCTRAELLERARAAGFEAWFDPSNLDPRHLRGWLRAGLLPALEARLPGIRDSIIESAEQMAEHRLAWDQLIDLLPGLDFQAEPGGASVAAPPLRGYSSAVLRAVVRAVGLRLGLPVGRRQLGRIQNLLAQGTTGQRVDLAGGVVATLDFDRLRLLRPVGHPGDYRAALAPVPGSVEAGNWSFTLRLESAPDPVPRSGMVTWLAGAEGIDVRPWRAGDRIRPLRGRGARLVVRCMQDLEVSRHDRPGWPVLERNGEIIWVPGVCRSGALVPRPGTEAVRIDASPRA